MRRDVHNGIVGARVRGAREARFPVIAFIDSHAEVLPGWLEPLVYRIYLNRKTVVVPSIRPIDTHGLSVSGGSFWPPPRGSFTWRMAFTHAGVDENRDAVYMGLGPHDASTPEPAEAGVAWAMALGYGKVKSPSLCVVALSDSFSWRLVSSQGLFALLSCLVVFLPWIACGSKSWASMTRRSSIMALNISS